MRRLEEEEDAVIPEIAVDLTGSSRVEVRIEAESVGRRGGVAGRTPVVSDFLDFFSRFWKCEYLKERRKKNNTWWPLLHTIECGKLGVPMHSKVMHMKPIKRQEEDIDIQLKKTNQGHPKLQ